MAQRSGRRRREDADRGDGGRPLSAHGQVYVDAFVAEERPPPGRRAASWSAIEAVLARRWWTSAWSWLVASRRDP